MLRRLAPSVVQDWLLPLREEHYAPQEAYLDHLAKLIEAIGRAGESVLVGRGAGFLLPRETTLSLRIIAPLRIRASRLAERMGVSVRTARRAARDLDRRRSQFDRTMHRMASADPHNYDMVLDSHSLGLDIAVEVIARAVEAGRPDAHGSRRHRPVDPHSGKPERNCSRSRARPRPSAGASPPAGLPPKNGAPPDETETVQSSDPGETPDSRLGRRCKATGIDGRRRSGPLALAAKNAKPNLRAIAAFHVHYDRGCLRAGGSAPQPANRPGRRHTVDVIVIASHPALTPVIPDEPGPRKKTPAEIMSEIAAMPMESSPDGFSGEDRGSGSLWWG